ncbi:MAG: SIR2 family protein [Chitinophagales bacterium]|nr:SIR2 family protein [Chitinophagales bacterium]
MEETITKLKQLLEDLNEIPILFTGAGFSYGATLNNGDPIPLGNKLKEVIIDDFIKATGKMREDLLAASLSAVSSFAQTQNGIGAFNDFICDLLKHVKPTKSHDNLVKYNWQKIYTTNVDDVLETIYTKAEKQYIAHNSKHANYIKDKSRVEYIKLHGCVLNKSEGFVFSSEDYVSAIKSDDWRFSSLRTDFGHSAFIFVGYSLGDINIDYFITMYNQSKNPSNKKKLFFIDPSDNTLLISKINSIGGIHIKWDTNEFLNFLATDVRVAYPQAQKVLSSAQSVGFININTLFAGIAKETSPYNSKLYWGEDASWKDIFHNWDFALPSLENVLDTFLDSWDKPNKTVAVFSIYGKPFTGKSSFIKRIGASLISKGYVVYEFEGLNNLDISRFVDLIYLEHKRGVRDIALLVDHASQYYYPIRDLAKRGLPDINLLIVTSERTQKHKKQKAQLLDCFFQEFEIPEDITRPFAINIWNALNSKGLLGSLKGKLLDDAVDKILSHRNCINFLWSLFHGENFRTKLINDVSRIFSGNTSNERDLLLSMVILEELGIDRFPRELAGFMFKTNADNIIPQIDDFVRVDHSGNLSLRMNFVNDAILALVTKEEKKECIKQILIDISAHVIPDDHSYWNELDAALSRTWILNKQLGIGLELGLQMLHSIQSYRTNNYNYWLLLGLAEKKLNRFDLAINHLQQANSLKVGRYMVEHALASTILMKAVKDGGVTNESAKELYKVGKNEMLAVLRKHKSLDVQLRCIGSLVQLSIQFFSKYPHFKPTKGELKELVSMTEAYKKTPVEAFQRVRALLKKYLSEINESRLMPVDLAELNSFQSYANQETYSFDDEE